METPAPVNLAALKGILANAKKVMNKVDADKPIVTANINTKGLTETYAPNYNESDEREPVYETYQPQAQSQAPTGPRDYTAEQVMASKLPDAVKKLMIAKPIPVLQGPPSSFTLADLGELVEKPKQKFTAPGISINETSTHPSNMITVSQEQLQAMIKEGIASYFREDYEKRITEAAIKKTISVLIKEGKLNVKKKTI